MDDALFPPGCVVVVGLRSEAALLPAGTRVLVSGADAARLEAMLAALPGDVRAALSFGIAGGLEPGLASGTLIAATRVQEGAHRWPADAAWQSRIAAATGARCGAIAASAGLVAGATEKAALHLETAALAVDMESGGVARFAAARGIPFAALRAVADTAQEAIPRAAHQGVAPDGAPAPLRVLAALLRRPQDLPGLIRLARASGRAHAALRLAVASARH